jgi:site-specific recombinase XerD
LALGESGKASIFAKVNSDVSGKMAMKSHVKSMKKSGHYRPHALRHSFCSLMTALGQSPFLVMGLVGHLSAQVHKNYAQSAVLYERAVAA